MICFNCGCFGHAKASCPHQKPSPSGDTSNVNCVVEKPNSEKTPTSSSGMDVADGPSMPNVEHTISGGHGPWMLMSYKNKKRDTMQNGKPISSTNSGSRFSVLINEDEGTDKTTSATLTEPTVTPTPSPTVKEPPIVSLWKCVQKKTQMRNDNRVVSPLVTDSDEPQSPLVYKSCNENKHPMQDITNGKAVGGEHNVKSCPSKPRKTRLVSKGLRTSSPASTFFPIPLPDISPG